MSLSNSMALRNKRKPRLKAEVKQRKAFPVEMAHIMVMVNASNKRSIRSAVFNWICVSANDEYNEIGLIY